MSSFFVIQGRDQGNRFEFDEDNQSLGRVSTNTIQLHDTEVSREHAKLEKNHGAFTLLDLQSSNGTFVNGERITEHTLRTGDQIQVGKTLLLFTGPVESSNDLTEQVNIITRDAKAEKSRIIHKFRNADSPREFIAASSNQNKSWLSKAHDNLQVMYRTALAVSHTLDIDQLLNRIMDLIFEWVEADRGCIMLKDSETGELKPQVRQSRKGNKSEDRITISKTILDYVIDNNEGVLTSNAKDDGRWDPAKSIVQMGVREAICVPMRGRYDMVGVIYIDTSISPAEALPYRDGVQKFTEDHLKLMIAIGHQAALAVEDTNYYQAMVQAERLAAVGQTIASLSHHVKNVLQGVRGGSYLIELGLEDHKKSLSAETIDIEATRKAVETVQKGWEIVERNQERITTLVMDMLTFSKDRDPEAVPSDLNAITLDAFETMQSRADELGVEIHKDFCKEMPTLMFDPDALYRAILNVITNAIDSCDQRDDGKVMVKTVYEKEPQVARVIVQDNGVGIEPNDMDQIFKIFVSRKGGRGTGLGLSVSKKMLNEHGGQILVDSELGKGSTFTVELPALLPKDSDSDGAKEPEDDDENSAFKNSSTIVS